MFMCSDAICHREKKSQKQKIKNSSHHLHHDFTRLYTCKFYIINLISRFEKIFQSFIEVDAVPTDSVAVVKYIIFIIDLHFSIHSNRHVCRYGIHRKTKLTILVLIGLMIAAVIVVVLFVHLRKKQSTG